MTTPSVFSSRGAEIAVRAGLLLLLVGACFLVIEPFIGIIAWAVIMAVAMDPAFAWLRARIGGHRRTAAALMTLGLLLVLIGPAIVLSETLVSGAQTLAARLQDGSLSIPPPPESVRGWPIVGERLTDAWSLAATNLDATLDQYKESLAMAGRWLVGHVAGLGLGILEFFAAVIVAGVLLATDDTSGAVGRRLARRLAGANGERYAGLAVATTRSVANGVLGVALLQAVLTGLGLLAVGIPGAGLWAMIVLVLCTAQLGPAIVLIPAAIYVFANNGTLPAVLFTAWCAFVMVIDNFLKPLLLGRGVDVPLVVVVVGAIGGLLTMGVVGLFVGAIVLVLGYSVLDVWLDQGSATDAP
jgi:predicted PurR-regulated permease PerM